MSDADKYICDIIIIVTLISVRYYVISEFDFVASLRAYRPLAGNRIPNPSYQA